MPDIAVPARHTLFPHLSRRELVDQCVRDFETQTLLLTALRRGITAQRDLDALMARRRFRVLKGGAA